MHKLIDFDKHFTDHLLKWMEDNRDNYRYADEMEQAMPEVYEAFLDTPQPWLDGQKPGEYFAQFDDAKALTDDLIRYVETGMDVPDMLLNRLAELEDGAEDALMAVFDYDGLSALSHDRQDELIMTAMTLLRQHMSLRPLPLYISWLTEGSMCPDVLDHAQECLESMGEAALPQLKDALRHAGDEGRETILSLLSRYPHTENVLEGLLQLFQQKPERRAVLAAYLGRFGDERALPALEAAAKDDDTPYLDFIEIRSAIEQLGGEAPEREFLSDDEYARVFADAPDDREAGHEV